MAHNEYFPDGTESGQAHEVDQSAPNWDAKVLKFCETIFLFSDDGKVETIDEIGERNTVSEAGEPYKVQDFMAAAGIVSPDAMQVRYANNNEEPSDYWDQLKYQDWEREE